jgi:hypothetical protein
MVTALNGARDPGGPGSNSRKRARSKPAYSPSTSG